jgi:copper chaperone CopZ
MKNSILIAFFFMVSLTFGQKKQTKDTAYIITSAQCGDCIDRIESALNFQRGVKYAELNLESKVATCIFKPAKVSIEKLRTAIAAAGYDADAVKADPKAQEQLPKCCQPNGH